MINAPRLIFTGLSQLDECIISAQLFRTVGQEEVVPVVYQVFVYRKIKLRVCWYGKTIQTSFYYWPQVAFLELSGYLK